MTDQVHAVGKPLTGRVVLVIVTAFFLTIIGVNLTMIVFAVRTLPGTEVDSAYRASLDYGDEIRAAHDQMVRDWRVSAHVTRQGVDAEVLIEARDNKDGPVPNAEFSARLERPADKRDDHSLEMTASGNGSYRGRASNVAAGQWDLVIEGIQSGNRVFASRNRIVLN